jgi:hypothetical protein
LQETYKGAALSDFFYFFVRSRLASGSGNCFVADEYGAGRGTGSIGANTCGV